MRITRHYLTINGRRVHYRRAGKGPPLLMVHQSPRSSAEYDGLMRDWGAHFTCIAPDTPGFGQSDPLAKPDADIDDFADALIAFVRALGLTHVAAYGFHSGAIILVTALKRDPHLFSGLAIGGYAIWTAQEMAIFGEAYLPPLLPSAYGEHLVWLWNRMLEQSWFFPWFDIRDQARLSVAHADVARVHAAVLEMLDAGDAYRIGYGAVLRAPRDIPPPDAVTPPVLISAYDGDPLQAHIDRLGAMPRGWAARKIATPAEHQALSLAFLQQLPAAACPALAADAVSGFYHLSTGQFDGLVHVDGDDIDLPGHGLSDGWPGTPPTDWAAWRDVVHRLRDDYGLTVKLPPLPKGDPEHFYPELAPDRFGAHLLAAWGIARARALFDPWYDVAAANVLPVDAARLDPARLARDTLAILRGRAAKALHIARLGEE
ncbi:MAG: alpha/beta fold hydrolase [Sphingopyxis sp.]|nr:alpha/beta fold hydrolase [Sphingopyxis sp.]